jgi:hypothetical protein
MKTTHTLFTSILLLFVFFLKAQDKYEFMIIEYKTVLGKELTISIDGKEYISENIDLPKNERSGSNANPFLKKVKEYQDQNWEVMSLNTVLGGGSGNIWNEVYFAYMRKKTIDKK